MKVHGVHEVGFTVQWFGSVVRFIGSPRTTGRAEPEPLNPER